MKIFKASNFGSGLSTTYQTITMENNTRVTGSFTTIINGQFTEAIPIKTKNLIRAATLLFYDTEEPIANIMTHLYIL